MNRPKCPYCGRAILDVVQVRMESPFLYYIKRDTWGRTWGPWYGIFYWRYKRKKTFKLKALGCRFCGEDFPKKMQKEVWKYLKMRRTLIKLTQNNA